MVRDVREDYDEYDEGRRPRGLLVPALVVALLVIGGLVAFALTSGGDGNDTADPAPEKSPTTQSSPKATQSSESTTETPAESTPADNGVPAGFTTYTDDSGFSVAVPEGWTAEASSSTAVDITDPSGTRFLRIDQTDSPKDDPKKDWESQEKSVEKRLDGYERVDIDEVDYNGWPAADWEFTFGNNTHVLNRGFVPNENKGYALYLSSSEEQWGESLQIFQTAADSFVPAGG